MFNIEHEAIGQEVSYSITLEKDKILSLKEDSQDLFLTNEFSENEFFTGEMYLNDEVLKPASYYDWDMMVDANGVNK